MTPLALPWWHAHVADHGGRLGWSGYGAEGDSSHRPWRAVVDLGRSYLVTSDGRLYLTQAPRHEFTPESLILAARQGLFGLRLLSEAEAESRRGGNRRRLLAKLDARKRSPEDIGKS